MGSNLEVIPVTRSDLVLSPAETARKFGISAKALRLYEQRGFITPIRNAAGWRHYGPEQLADIREVVALRALGLSLAQIGAVLAGERQGLEAALASHQTRLEASLAGTRAAIERVRLLRNDLSQGQTLNLADLAVTSPAASFALPWPWAGEIFELRRLARVTYLVGPLGSGKTRLAMALAEALSGAFVGLDRTETETMSASVSADLQWFLEDGATDSPALRAVLAAMAGEGERVRVIDLVEDGLDEITQLALGAWLRRRGETDAPVIVMTRSNALLDLDALPPEHAILYCPANHSMPFEVLAVPGSPGHESVVNCLATPAARTRTAGLVARVV